MEADYFNSSIRKFSLFAEKHEMRDSVVCNVKLPRSEEFNRISMDSTDYVEIYERGLSLSHYNILLYDLSYFQFSHRSSLEWALAYYPNPRVSGNSDALQDYRDLKLSNERQEITDEELSELLSSFPPRNFIPRFRYEYSDDQYEAVKHPIAHFHIGMSGQDRWGVSRKISPFSFGLLMVKYFHPAIWWEKSRFSLPASERQKDHIIKDCFDNILVDSLRSDGVAEKLENEESLSFHFSALIGANK